MALTPVDPGGSLQEGGLANAESQGDFREQIANLTALMQQVAGAGAAVKGGAAPSDPLSSPFFLYVNPYVGSDDYAPGYWNTYEESGGTTEEIIEAKLRRIDSQQLVCGYSPQRPFKTINRAVIEAAAITSKGYYTFDSGEAEYDCVVIHLAPGVHTVINDPGEVDTTNVPEWTDGMVPTEADLAKFNPFVGGLILPRYVSLAGADLRKVTIRPTYVPAPVNENADFSNRTAIFRTTASGYYFGFSFFDKLGSTDSHHLLDCFQFASQTQLDIFYQKIKKAIEVPSLLRPQSVKTRVSEWEIAAPLRDTNPDESWDSVVSSSPYIFNCSIRSELGLGGIFADGAGVGGFKSMVVAQFTGVSLQKDYRAWDVYSGEQWTQAVNYDQYVSADPDDVRMNPGWLSRHVSAINSAVIQEVSVFAIGQGIHHFTDTGGEITITNSNSNFGGCASLSKGYRQTAYPLDRNWQTRAIKNANNLSNIQGNIRQITLGQVDFSVDNGATTIKLTTQLSGSPTVAGEPDLVARDGYTLREDSYLWIENTSGPDYRATLAADAWDPLTADELIVKEAFLNEDGNAPGAEISEGSVSVFLPDLAGLRVYIRRMVDTRSPSERRYTLLMNNTAPTRVPLRDFVVQADPGTPPMVREFNANELLQIGRSIKLPGQDTGTEFDVELTLRQGNSAFPWDTNTFYRQGEHVLTRNKHWIAKQDHTSTDVFDTNFWTEEFVHMPEAYSPEAPYRNEAPTITFDNDTDGVQATRSCGYDLINGWTTDPLLQQQYRNATDYRGMKLFLVGIGFTEAEADVLLVPRTEGDRDWPTDVQREDYNPNGAASGWGNWALTIRRPSVIRLYGHAFEWPGYGNYSKALPRIQQELSPQNRFTYYFTNVDGGRVYATGSNENGFAVTPFGLEDISTGETLAVDRIGGSDTEIEVGVSFDTLNLQSLTVTGKAEFGAISGIGNGAITWDENALPPATTSTSGVVELAEAGEVRDVFNGKPVAEADTSSSRVVPLSGLSGLKSAVLTEVRLLEPRYRYLYVDGGVTYTYEDGRTGQTSWQPGAVAERSSVPDDVWTDIKHYRNLHELNNWSGTVPPAGSPQAALAGAVCHRKLSDVYSFLDNRAPSNGKDIIISFYGTLIDSGVSTGNIEYRNTIEVFWVKGRSQVATGEGYGPTICMNSSNYRFDRNGALNIIDLVIDATASVGDLGRYGRLQYTITAVDSSGVSTVNLHNTKLSGRQSFNGWVICIRATNLAIHRRRANIGNSNPNSRVVFDITTDDFGNNYPNRGNLILTQTTNLSVLNNRSKTNTSINGERLLSYIVDAQNFNRGGFVLHGINDGTVAFSHNRAPDNSQHVGGIYRFDIASPQGFQWCANAGISSGAQAMNVRFVQDVRDKPTVGDPEQDIVFEVVKITTTQPSWPNFKIFSPGTGNVQDFAKDWDDEDSSLPQLARQAMYSLASPTPPTSNSTTIKFATMAFLEGGKLNGDLFLNPTYQALNSTNLFQLSGGGAFGFAAGTAAAADSVGIRTVDPASGYGNSAIIWPKEGTNKNPEEEVPLEPLDEDTDSVPVG